jgi:hypothetical protein
MHFSNETQFKMKIIEPKGDIYDVLSDGVAGEN